MTTTLQIALPDDLTLSPEALARITGRTTRPAQISWLAEHRWKHELAADGSVIVGQLYAHLRLAGLQPDHITASPAAAGDGFNLSNVR